MTNVHHGGLFSVFSLRSLWWSHGCFTGWSFKKCNIQRAEMVYLDSDSVVIGTAYLLFFTWLEKKAQYCQKKHRRSDSLLPLRRGLFPSCPASLTLPFFNLPALFLLLITETSWPSKYPTFPSYAHHLLNSRDRRNVESIYFCPILLPRRLGLLRQGKHTWGPRFWVQSDGGVWVHAF